MANVLKKVTITQQGSTSGPLYDIFYSIDGVTYTICVDGDTILLNNRQILSKDVDDFEYAPKDEYQSIVKVYNE